MSLRSNQPSMFAFFALLVLVAVWPEFSLANSETSAFCADSSQACDKAGVTSSSASSSGEAAVCPSNVGSRPLHLNSYQAQVRKIDALLEGAGVGSTGGASSINEGQPRKGP